MQMTISSVLTMCFLGSIFIAALCMLSKSNLVMRRIGPGCLTTLLILIVLRMFVPFEFPFTHDIGIEEVLTGSFRFLFHDIIEKPFSVTVWDLLLLVWICGIVLLLLYKLYAYHDVVRYLSLCPQESWEDLSRQYDFTIETYQEMETVRVIRGKKFSSPFLIGLRRPCLILPEMPYEKEQFQYILLHEWMHVKHKDIAWKVLVELLCTAFWWNPILWRAKTELFQLIEMRNDMQIVSGLTATERVAYIECLTKTALQLSGKDMAFGVSFCKRNFRELKRRIELIADGGKFSRWRQFAVSGMVAVLLLITTLIIFEPYSNDASEGTAITEENGFLIKNGDQFDVYVEGRYLFTTDELTGLTELEIYHNLQEAMENE